MPWIELHHGFAGHKKVGDLARALGVERRVAIGTLACLWSWAVAMVRHGDVTGQEEEIAHATYFRGEPEQLMAALVATGWVDRDEATGALCIHDWEDYAGRYEDAKAKARQRKQAERDRRKGEGVTRTSRGRHADVTRTDTVTSRETVRDFHAEVTPYMYMTNTSTGTFTGTEREPGEAPLRGANAPTGACPRAHEADPYLAFDAGQPARMPSEGQSVPQEQASGTSDGQGHPTDHVKGLPGPPVELSTKLSTPSYPEAFEALWAATPQQGRTRSGKPKAYKAWVVATKRAKPEEIAAGLEAFKASHDWRKEGGHFVPGLHVWLGREVWGERLEVAPQGLMAAQGLPQGKAAPSPEYGSAVTGGALAAVEMAKARIAARAAGVIEVEASEVSHG